MRRELRFKTFDEALAELDRLEAGRVETLGVWSHAQILEHCAAAVEKSMDRFTKRAPWFIRLTLGRAAKRRILKQGYMEAGYGDRKTERKEGDAKAAAQRLRNAIARYRTHTGPLDGHPFCGRLSRDEWDKMHLYHTANHLGFLRRTDDPAP